ncbi:DUF2690 domain-containing protein [Kitasatospora cineracea]|uniref:DUF2690 domain-containing protein n=1 Tax=Kitasatospora cineracea TaxID=88074 RepID=UPI003444C223
MGYSIARREVRCRSRLARWRTVLAALFSLVMTSAGVVATASPAAAEDPYCWESECDGKSPVNTNCAADPITVEEWTYSDMIDMKLLYSSTCDAYWGHVQIDPNLRLNPVYNGVFYVPQLGGVEKARNGLSVTSENIGSATPMVSSMYSVKVCETEIANNYDPTPGAGPGGGGDCTQWH